MFMRGTRKIIAEFVGVFVIGGLAGGLLTWSYTDRELTSFMSRTNNQDKLVERITKKYTDEYHFSPEELARIQPLILEMAQHVYQVRHRFSVDILAVGDEYHQKIAEQLTPEHRTVYEKAIADRRQQLTSLLQLDQTSPTPGTK